MTLEGEYAVLVDGVDGEIRAWAMTATDALAYVVKAFPGALHAEVTAPDGTSTRYRIDRRGGLRLLKESE